MSKFTELLTYVEAFFAVEARHIAEKLQTMQSATAPVEQKQHDAELPPPLPPSPDDPPPLPPYPPQSNPVVVASSSLAIELSLISSNVPTPTEDSSDFSQHDRRARIIATVCEQLRGLRARVGQEPIEGLKHALTDILSNVISNEKGNEKQHVSKIKRFGRTAFVSSFRSRTEVMLTEVREEFRRGYGKRHMAKYQETIAAYKQLRQLVNNIGYGGSSGMEKIRQLLAAHPLIVYMRERREESHITYDESILAYALNQISAQSLHYISKSGIIKALIQHGANPLAMTIVANKFHNQLPELVEQFRYRTMSMQNPDQRDETYNLYLREKYFPLAQKIRQQLEALCETARPTNAERPFWQRAAEIYFEKKKTVSGTNESGAILLAMQEGTTAENQALCERQIPRQCNTLRRALMDLGVGVNSDVGRSRLFGFTQPATVAEEKDEVPSPTAQ